MICSAFNLSRQEVGLLNRTIEFSLIDFVEISAMMQNLNEIS